MSQAYKRFAQDQEERFEGHGVEEREEILKRIWRWSDSSIKSQYKKSTPKDKGKERVPW